MANTSNDDLQKELAWFKDLCDKNDKELERLRTQLDEYEQNIEVLLKENERLSTNVDATETQPNTSSDQQTNNDLIVENSLLRHAIEVYKSQLLGTRQRAEQAETLAQDFEKRYNDAMVVRQFLANQLSVTNKAQKQNGIVDLFRENIPNTNTCGSLKSNQKFVQSVAENIAVAQCSVGQFCKRYRLDTSTLEPDGSKSSSESDQYSMKDNQTELSVAQNS